MKTRNRARWIIGLTILFAFGVGILTQVDSVKATFSHMHAVAVLYRVETEIMQKTPAGQYYEALFWKHNDELMHISVNHPENEEEFLQIIRLFIPALESLLDGEGDTVQLTSEQIERLNAELDWLASVGSPALREDIRKEQERFPLTMFAGMSMSEALDFINSTWSPETVIEKPLVPESGGQWAYYLHDELYLEYPSSYNPQMSEAEKDFIYFMPSFGIPEQWKPYVMKVRVWKVPSGKADKNNPIAWYAAEHILWQNGTQTADFSGIEFIAKRPSSSDMHFHSFQYNEERGLAVNIWVFVAEPPPLTESMDYSAMIDQHYEYFRHMTNSLRIQP